MDWGDVVSLGVAMIAAVGMYASHRSSARASTISSETMAKLDAEKEAYNRAREHDVETIQMQKEEIKELRADNRDLHEKIGVARAEAREARREAREAHAEADRLRSRVALLERHQPDDDPDIADLS